MNGFIKDPVVADFEPDLLVRPMPSRVEGPNGYLFRLGEDNCLTLDELKQLGVPFEPTWLAKNRLLPDAALDPDLHAHVNRMGQLFQDKGRIWNQRHARFCPLCLVEEPRWRASWEILFHDACAHHGVWLVDQCSSCRRQISWKRDSLLRCECGSDLRQEPTTVAPDSVCRLACILERRLLGLAPAEELPILAGLDLEQIQRLVRYLGGYMDPISGPKPLKLRNASSLQASWPVSSLAAEILDQWPRAFHDCWSRMQDQVEGDKLGLKGVFKRAHTYLYKGLQGGAFAPIRDAFETWLTQHWKGGLSKRNRNLTKRLLADAQWVPGKVAADQLRISIARLRGLVRDGYLEGQESVSSTGRRFVVVRRDQLAKIDAQLANEMTMSEAMEALGIGKVRMRRVLKLLFPNARRLNNQDKMPWCVPRAEVDALFSVGEHLPVTSITDEQQVSLAHILRYWTWNTDSVVALVEAVRAGLITPLAVLDSCCGITRWVFDKPRIRAWYASLNDGRKSWLTIPEVAKLLHVHQQTAYWLARNEYLPSEKLGPGRGPGSRVRREEIELFGKRYVFATELAAYFGCHSRRVLVVLAAHGIQPLQNKYSAEPCRQRVYVRNEEIFQAMESWREVFQESDHS